MGMWESGKNRPAYETLLKIAETFGVSVDDLTGAGVPGPRKGVKIPVLGCVQAGIPSEAVENILDYEEISPEMASQGEFFALKVRGNSMEPRFSPGDVVIVRRQPTVESGEIGVVLVNGDCATVKKVVRYPGGISLVAFNPTYDPMYFSNEEIESLPVSILGKVVELRAKF